MPLYEFGCTDCTQKFEVLYKSYNDLPAEGPTCPSCGGRHTQKVLSTFAAHVGGGYSSAASSPCGDMPSYGGCGAPQCGGGQCGMG